ncbi:unnamed protein product [Oncorhynchus mykiss]|uniref:Core-binding factor subunit beta n=1 Tax=Oncorhynchus mykiss TaxID=8022 RepID=A0A060X8P0_ONCMY|nr:unnamed protein product [Oncorhynchus mykiss]
MILNGVCVIWKGWIDMLRLDGMGCLEFDEERAQHEDALAQAAFEDARRRTRDFEDRDRSHREDLENHHCQKHSFITDFMTVYNLKAVCLSLRLFCHMNNYYAQQVASLRSSQVDVCSELELR